MVPMKKILIQDLESGKLFDAEVAEQQNMFNTTTGKCQKSEIVLQQLTRCFMNFEIRKKQFFKICIDSKFKVYSDTYFGNFFFKHNLTKPTVCQTGFKIRKKVMRILNQKICKSFSIMNSSQQPLLFV